jgi:hypothetical protein
MSEIRDSTKFVCRPVVDIVLGEVCILQYMSSRHSAFFIQFTLSNVSPVCSLYTN